ncbi:hypothetical protein GN956_G26329 [Arapaima gigas]
MTANQVGVQNQHVTQMDHLRHTKRTKEMRKALLHLMPLPCLKSRTALEPRGRVRCSGVSHRRNLKTSVTVKPPFEFRQHHHLKLQYSSFRWSRCQTRKGQMTKENPQMTLVQRNWDIQELIDVAGSLPDQNEVGGECFWKEILDLEEIYQPSAWEWTQVLRRRLKGEWSAVRGDWGGHRDFTAQFTVPSE